MRRTANRNAARARAKRKKRLEKALRVYGHRSLEIGPETGDGGPYVYALVQEARRGKLLELMRDFQYFDWDVPWEQMAENLRTLVPAGGPPTDES